MASLGDFSESTTGDQVVKAFVDQVNGRTYGLILFPTSPLFSTLTSP